jgi:hypothetical protein
MYEINIDRDSGGGLRRFIYWDPHVNPSYVADAHLSNPPMSIKYAIVVPRETVHIAFRITALDNIDVQATDTLNTYLKSPCDEKVWTILGPEFGPELERKRAIIVRSLYGLKSSEKHIVIIPRHTLNTWGLHAVRLILVCGFA